MKNSILLAGNIPWNKGMSFAAIALVILFSSIPLVLSTGPRFDAPENEPQDVQDCYREGYEQGFAHQYDEDIIAEDQV